MAKMHRHFDEELSQLKEKLLKMAGMAEEAISNAVKALVERDSALAQKVVEDDRRINEMEIEIDDFALTLLALKTPIAIDLRFVTSAMKINNDLERIGDLAVNVAQRALNLIKAPALKPLIDIPRMAQIAQKMLDDSLEAFISNDSVLARDVCLRDDEVDSLNDQIFRELLTYMIQDPKSIERAVDLILVGRNLERIADHTTNICEDIIYVVDGKNVRHHLAEGEF